MAPKINNRKARIRFHEAMLSILLLCGYNYNYFEKNVFMKIVAKFYCITLILGMMYATFACRRIQNWTQTWPLLEYVLSSLIILGYKTRMKLFLEKLRLIDMYLRINYKHYSFELYKIIAFTIVLWLIRISYVCLYCGRHYCYDILSLYVISQFSMISLDVNGVWRSVIFDVIRYRLKLLRIRLEETPENNFYLYVNNYKTLKENKLRLLLYIYRSIADVLALISPELNATLFLSVVFNMPTLIAHVYHVLVVIETREPSVILVCGSVVLHSLQIISSLFTPFFIVEFYSIEVERIRLFLIHKVIDETDPIIIADAELFIKYTELRPFSYKIWRIIPVNVRLPLELINLCLNFVLVLRNFTHLYE